MVNYCLNELILLYVKKQMPFHYGTYSYFLLLMDMEQNADN